MTDSRLSVNETTFEELSRFLAEPKFRGEDFYPEPSRELREAAESCVNELARRLIAGLACVPTKAFVLAEFKATMAAFDECDSDEQDRLVGYLTRLLDILGIDGSDGVIGAWRYGTFEAANDP